MWTWVPFGIADIGSAQPTRIGASGPAWTTASTSRPTGAKMYRFSPSEYAISAIRAVRLGSYSIPTTRPDSPTRSRRFQSIRR